MDVLTKEDIRSIISSPNVNDYEVRKIIYEELKLKIPKDLSREEMVDFVFEEYQKALHNIEEKKQEVRESLPKVKNGEIKKSNGEITKKQFIINLVVEGVYTRKQIIDKVNDQYGYNLTGKTSKVRVSKVLKELHINNKIILNPAGLVQYKDTE